MEDKHPVNFTNFDDENLMRLINGREEGALSELYDRYGRLVYSIGLNALGDPATAEEITQDVFLRVWDRAETYQAEQGKVVTWLARIARNRAIDLIRRRNVRPEANSVTWDDLPLSNQASENNTEQVVELNQQQERVRWAIAQLPTEQKQALALAYFQGLSHQEIADRLDQPLGTVKTRVRLAMQKLKILLTEI
jgi:RNA polymerase sigma-70 factor, ECF subfamily